MQWLSCKIASPATFVAFPQGNKQSGVDFLSVWLVQDMHSTQAVEFR